MEMDREREPHDLTPALLGRLPVVFQGVAHATSASSNQDLLTACTTHTVCPIGTYASSAATPSSDRVCASCVEGSSYSDLVRTSAREQARRNEKRRELLRESPLS